LPFTVAHLQSCTGKWNHIEHRVFAFVPSTPIPSEFAGRNPLFSYAQNWLGKSRSTHQVIVQLIASTTVQIGLIT